jgi:uncharacterized protein (DUF58 family)
MFPSRALVLLLVAPLVLGVAVAADASLVWPMLATDGAIAAAALIDLALTRRRLVKITRKSDQVFSIGRANRVVLEVRSRARRALKLEIVDDLFERSDSADLPIAVRVPARGHVEVHYNVTPSHRGSYELGDHRVRYRSPLGLWIRQQRIPARSAVRVYPDVQAVRVYEALARADREVELVRATRRRGGESEFECLREYTRDDEYRSIDWKATGRRRKLISRQYQLERNQSIVFALDCGRAMTPRVGSLPAFDHALNAALMLGYVAARGGDHVGIMTFADDVRAWVAPTGGAGAVRKLVRGSFDVHPELVETNYSTSFLRLGAQLRKRSLVVVFTRIIDDRAATELLAVTRALRPRHLPLVVLLRDGDLDELAVPPEKAVGDLFVAAAAAELLVWRDKLVRELQRAGALVLDVLPGDITPHLVRRYLDVKVRHLL